MKNGSRKHDRVFASLVGVMGLACSPLAQAVDYIPLTTFATDPTSTTASGWQKSSSSATWSASGYLNAASGGWYSPVFTPTAGQYYGIQYDVQLTTAGAKAQFGTFFGNPAATYNLETTTAAGGYLYRDTATHPNVINGQLLDDNYTSIQPAGSGWSTITTYTRMPVNATQSFIYFGPDTSGARVDNVRVFSATHADVLAFSDAIYSNTANFPVAANHSTYTPLTRFANLPNTYNKLSSGQPVSMVLLGDSIVQDTTNSYFDVMVERNFPGSSVTIKNAQGHGTGMDYWLNPSPTSWQQAPLKIQEAVYDQSADLVIIGGISNGGAANLAATQTIVQALKALGKEVLLTTGDFGNTLNAAQFSPTVNGSTTGSDPTLTYRNSIYNLAASEDVGFFDTYGAYGSYLLQLRAAGMTDDAYYRDHWTHANTTGKEFVGQLYSSYFTPVPEPASLGLAVLALLPLTRRMRQR